MGGWMKRWMMKGKERCQREQDWYFNVQRQGSWQAHNSYAELLQKMFFFLVNGFQDSETDLFKQAFWATWMVFFHIPCAFVRAWCCSWRVEKSRWNKSLRFNILPFTDTLHFVCSCSPSALHFDGSQPANHKIFPHEGTRVSVRAQWYLTDLQLFLVRTFSSTF